MAREIYAFPVTVPAGTPQVSPQVSQLQIPPRAVQQIEVIIPPGPKGAVGFQIGSSGQQILPTNPGMWFVVDNEKISWPLENMIDSGAWTCTAYNTGSFNHTIYVRLLVVLPNAAPAGSTSPIPPGNISNPPPGGGVRPPAPVPIPVVPPFPAPTPIPAPAPPPPPPPARLPRLNPTQLDYIQDAITDLRTGEGEVWNSQQWGTPVGGAVPQGWLDTQVAKLGLKAADVGQKIGAMPLAPSDTTTLEQLLSRVDQLEVRIRNRPRPALK